MGIIISASGQVQTFDQSSYLVRKWQPSCSNTSYGSLPPHLIIQIKPVTQIQHNPLHKNHFFLMNLSSIYILPLLFLITHGKSFNLCQETRCRSNGPPIRFPFRIKNKQPDLCGYPGFDLSCTESKHTLLELPNSVKLYIDRIDYVSQVLYTYDPNNCLPKQILNFKLSNTPYKYGYFIQSDYYLFNCSSLDRNEYVRMPCLSVPGYDVYAFIAETNVMFTDLAFCTKMYNVSSVPLEFVSSDNVLQLNWTRPGCGICEGQGMNCKFRENSTRFETECVEKPKGPSRVGFKLMISGIVIGSVLLVVAAVVVFRIYSSDRAEKENQKRIEKFLGDYKAMKPARYLYSDIKRITNNFKDKLGQGAYGSVFKGSLSSDIFVAVKVLNSSTGNGEEFINEVGTMGRIHHVNVVRLVGFCADGFRRALVYEYLPNESLQKSIFSNDDKDIPLGWEKLQDIALGVAKGIEYLHQGCDQRILHFDIKPHNILLDENFNPKISDFGLAKLCAKDQSAISMTTARGTMGYIAPEVFSRNFGNVSYKSDVYSFGMVLLDMVSGRKNVDVDDTKVYFPEWVYNRLDKGEELRIRIKEEVDEKIAKKLIFVGLWCIQWHPMDRPSMKAVVQMLEGEDNKLITMPPNPFGSADASFVSAGMGVNMARRHLHQDLAVISETETE
ncbi:rust resistance kinase Lr10-like [Mercurialis annua]|uniref:rust resistance kinase Lr10-like n=1 Tax=Mercurialis annua TaxID=3986 RepID=UPI0021608C05|nr:rust resistance kinase Lr10-like [Mercurialis annua]